MRAIFREPISLALITRSINSVLSVILTPVVSDLVPHWSSRYGESIEEAGRASESKFGCINPMCILEAMCRLHPNTVYRELIDDLIPTFDRVFSKLVRLNLSGVESLDQLMKTKVLRAIEAGQVDESVHQVSELCRSLERKYLETLERTG